MGNGWVRTKNIVVKAGVANVKIRSVLEDDLQFFDFQVERWLSSKKYRTIPVRKLREMGKKVIFRLSYLYYNHEAFLMFEEDDKIYVSSSAGFDDFVRRGGENAFVIFLMDTKEYGKIFGISPRIPDTIPEHA